MSVICGISTYHLIDTSAPCRLIGAELSSARLPRYFFFFLSLTSRAKRQTWRKGAAKGMVWKGTGSQTEPLTQGWGGAEN